MSKKFSYSIHKPKSKEKEIVKLLKQGLDFNQVADKLDISPLTVLKVYYQNRDDIDPELSK